MFPCPVIPAPFAKLSELIASRPPAGTPGEAAINDELLQCSAFLQVKPHLGVPLHIFEFAELFRSVEAEAFISSAEGHEIIETESNPRARARI